MKRIALILSFLLLMASVSVFAANTDDVALPQLFRDAVQRVDTADQPQQNGPRILGETVIFEEDFEGELGWFFDGGYGELGGLPEVEIVPPAWEFSDVKANSPVTSLFHDDNVGSSRDFAFSPAFTVPETIDGDPVVSAKVSYQINIDNPGYSHPTSGYLGDYYMVYVGLEETTWSIVDVEGDMVYYSGYPEANSFQFLTSPVMDLTAAAGTVTLDFKYLMINELNWDLGRVDVLVEGEEGYTTIGMLDDDSGTWMDMSADLSAFAGKMIQVRIAFLPDDGTMIEGGGLWVNDLMVTDDNGTIWMDDAEEGNASMDMFGVTLARLFYDYDRVEDGGAEFHPWDESVLFNGTADLFDLGIQPGDQVWLALRYIIDETNEQGEPESAGAFFDDIMVTAISGVPADVGVSDLVVGYPRTGGVETPMAATVSNFGFEGQTAALWYKFDEGAGMPVPPFLTLDAFADSTVVFGPKMPVADSTMFTSYTVLNSDMVPENDALATMLYPDAAGMATFNYSKSGFTYFSTANRISAYNPMDVLGVDSYNLESVDLYMYNAAGAEDVVNVKVATWDTDPLSPTEILVDQDVNFDATGGVLPVSLPVNAMDLMSPVAVWVTYEASAGNVGLLLDDGTPFAGNEFVYDADETAWFISGLGQFIYANVSYSTEPSFKIAIDAEKDGWYETLTGTQDGKVILPASSYNTNGEPDDDADLSAVLWTAWDETYLYLYEEVKDNVVNLNNATSWQDDVLEVYIDPDPSAEITTNQIGFHITALDSADADPAALAGVINLQGYNLETGATPADYARKRTDDGYVLEVRVAWDSLKDATRMITPAVGNVFGMATMNHDNDDAQREGSVSFATVLNDNVWNTPAHHGTVTFMEDHKLAFEASNLRDTSLVNLRAEVYETNTLPAPWRTLDIGDAMDAPGMVEYVDGTVKVMASGSDIWGTKDDLRFGFITMSGDAEITAQVARLDSVHDWAKAGVMIRDGLSDSSAHVIMAATTGNGTAMQWRSALGGESDSEHTYDTWPVKAPVWVKLIRMGDTFTGYISEDGEMWDYVGKTQITMADPVQVGLAVTSHVYATYTTAEFTDIDLSTTPMEPKLNFDIAIDAEKDAWYKSLTGPENGYLSISAAAYNDNGQPDNADDHSAMMWAGWDETYLYMYEEVKDNVVNVNNATSWQNDVLEVYIDPDPSADITTNQIGFQITALDSADAEGDGVAGVTNLSGYNLDTGATPADYARKQVTGGYVLETRVAWDSLKDATRSITPEVGYMIGMAFHNHDNDDAQREGSIAWAAQPLDNVWNTPANHGTVEFLADHKLSFSATSLRDTTIVNPRAPLYAPNELPEEWLAMDIGAVGTPGVVTENDGVWDITASGSDIWGTMDEFTTAFQVFKGDIDIQCQVTGLTNVNEWGKAGVMIRDELTGGSKHAIMAVTTENGAAFQWRPEADGESQSANGMDYVVDITAPQYVKIQRIGDMIQGWVSEDGRDWLKVGSAEIVMSEQIYVGLFVTSHDNTQLSTGTFGSVRIRTTNINAVEEDVVAELPTEFALEQNYPNPFNPTTTINFALPKDVKVKLTVFDILGREVATLVDENMEAGIHQVNFDAARYASGVYFYRLKAGDRVFHKKMMLMK